MFGAQAFDGIVKALVLIGVLLGLVVFGAPAYFLGRYQGKQAIYREAAEKGLLEIRYDPRTGEKLMIWRKP